MAVDADEAVMLNEDLQAANSMPLDSYDGPWSNRDNGSTDRGW
jgi:hypothetical protein